MDGGLGHGNKIHSKSKLTVEETLEVDRFKDLLAQENNVTVIRIDCYYNINNQFYYIKNEILNNKELNKNFDLSNINWDECHKNACSSLIKNVCDFYNLYTTGISAIANQFRIHRSTVRRYLKQGAEIGLCDYGTR